MIGTIGRLEQLGDWDYGSSGWKCKLGNWSFELGIWHCASYVIGTVKCELGD